MDISFIIIGGLVTHGLAFLAGRVQGGFAGFEEGKRERSNEDFAEGHEAGFEEAMTQFKQGTDQDEDSVEGSDEDDWDEDSWEDEAGLSADDDEEPPTSASMAPGGVLH